jgi:exodeoxyribonuclease VIII
MSDIHVSIDLETLGTRADCTILSIGAAAKVNGEVTTFFAPVNLSEESQGTRIIDSDTLEWWRKKGDLFTETLNSCRYANGLIDVLQSLSTWYTHLGTDSDRLYPWGNGASFDIAILDHAYASNGTKPPWAFWMVRDLRTLKHLAQDAGAYAPIDRSGKHHVAVDDAIDQLEMIETWWAALTK